MKFDKLVEREYKALSEALNISGVNDIGLGKYILSGFAVVSQTHLLHGLTKIAQTHDALGDFYEELQGLLDELLEMYLAIGGECNTEQNILLSRNLNVDMILSNFRKETVSVIGKIKMSDNEASLSAINEELVDIVELIDKTIYRMDLK